MGRMVRKQVYIELRQEALLKRRAAELGVAEAELIRLGIDQVAMRGFALPVDAGAWAKARGYIAERRRLVVPQSGRAWGRDDLYAERIDRLPH